ncbi:MAG: flagellar hook-basal body complex protein FliE [Oscillospiraceae bacterium]|nr:flagellar hook-basal body complex protein FliE [Oscillospiraceae bacterium]
MRIDNSFIAASRLSQPLGAIQKSEEDSEKKGIAGGFEKIFDDLWKSTEETSAASKAETAKLVIGEQDDLAKMQVAGEKSSIMFELNLTVRNKVIDAYTEILKTQV